MSSAVPTTQGTGRHLRLGALIALFLAPAFIFANMYTTQAILPVLSHDFRISAPTAGLTVSLLVLAVAIGSLFYGPLSDRVGRKKVMVGTSFLVIIPTLLCGLAPNFATLVILRTIQGLLMPGLTSVAIPYVNEEFAGRDRGLAMGIYVSGLTLGGLFARVGSAALTGLYSWQVSMLAFTLPTLIAALAMWRFLPETNSKLKTPQGEAHPRPGAFLRQTLHDMWLHLHNRRLVGAFIIGFTLFFGFIGTFTYLPYYLTGPHFRLSTISLGLVYLLWLAGGLSPVAGSIAERIGSRRSIAFTMGLAACGLLTTLIPALPVVIVGLGMLAVGMFCTVPAVNLYLGEQAATAKGTAASMYLSLYYFGGSFGAVLPGITFLWAGWLGVVFLCLGMVLIALASDAILC
ncbi:MAG: MFS transporter [Ktedonobacteraceae bacterium]|nr:MFS transporter [Ktedonobacteraceae bacterium]